MTIRALGLAALVVSSVACAQEIHFSPEERLDAIDAALIGEARGSIDFASYALTDSVVLSALNAAVALRLNVRQPIQCFSMALFCT